MTNPREEKELEEILDSAYQCHCMNTKHLEPDCQRDTLLSLLSTLTQKHQEEMKRVRGGMQAWIELIGTKKVDGKNIMFVLDRLLSHPKEDV